MTYLCDGFFLVEKVPDDSLAVRVVPDIFRGPASGNHERGVVGWVDVGESEVGIPAVTGFLGVGIVSRLKVVHHEMQFFL